MVSYPRYDLLRSGEMEQHAPSTGSVSYSGFLTVPKLLSRCSPAPQALTGLCRRGFFAVFRDIFQRFTTFLDAFRQFWYILHYIYFEQDGREYGQPPYPFQI